MAIADVSEYVVEDTNLDKEAKARGFSIYFPHKSIPMLPRELSENICSLKEGVNRLAVVCAISLDDDMQVVKEEFFEAVIKVKRKYTYNRVDELLQDKNCKDDKEILGYLFANPMVY